MPLSDQTSDDRLVGWQVFASPQIYAVRITRAVVVRLDTTSFLALLLLCDVTLISARFSPVLPILALLIFAFPIPIQLSQVLVATMTRGAAAGYFLLPMTDC